MNISLITFIEGHLCSGWKDHLRSRGDDRLLGKSGSGFAGCRVGEKDGWGFAWRLSKQEEELAWGGWQVWPQKKGKCSWGANPKVSSAAKFLLSSLGAGRVTQHF